VAASPARKRALQERYAYRPSDSAATSDPDRPEPVDGGRQ
jgi:hypothetical protein